VQTFGQFMPMKHPEFTCTACGSTNMRRSQRTSILDVPKMAFGAYPFRCLDCRERFWINVWRFSRSKHIICPHCLVRDVTPISSRQMRVGLWRKILFTAGGRGYRCSVCKHAFVSLRRKHASQAAGSGTGDSSAIQSRPEMPSAAARAGK
jgi:DNA-directed RNA polymerase subunit RPC12/RpoP